MTSNYQPRGPFPRITRWNMGVVGLICDPVSDDGPAGAGFNDYRLIYGGGQWQVQFNPDKEVKRGNVYWHGAGLTLSWQGLAGRYFGTGVDGHEIYFKGSVLSLEPAYNGYANGVPKIAGAAVRKYDDESGLGRQLVCAVTTTRNSYFFRRPFSPGGIDDAEMADPSLSTISGAEAQPFGWVFLGQMPMDDPDFPDNPYPHHNDPDNDFPSQHIDRYWFFSQDGSRAAFCGKRRLIGNPIPWDSVVVEAALGEFDVTFAETVYGKIDRTVASSSGGGIVVSHQEDQAIAPINVRTGYKVNSANPDIWQILFVNGPFSTFEDAEQAAQEQAEASRDNTGGTLTGPVDGDGYIWECPPNTNNVQLFTQVSLKGRIRKWTVTWPEGDGTTNTQVIQAEERKSFFTTITNDSTTTLTETFTGEWAIAADYRNNELVVFKGSYAGGGTETLVEDYFEKDHWDLSDTDTPTSCPVKTNNIEFHDNPQNSLSGTKLLTFSAGGHVVPVHEVSYIKPLGPLGQNVSTQETIREMVYADLASDAFVVIEYFGDGTVDPSFNTMYIDTSLAVYETPLAQSEGEAVIPLRQGQVNASLMGFPISTLGADSVKPVYLPHFHVPPQPFGTVSDKGGRVFGSYIYWDLGFSPATGITYHYHLTDGDPVVLTDLGGPNPRFHPLGVS